MAIKKNTKSKTRPKRTQKRAAKTPEPSPMTRMFDRLDRRIFEAITAADALSMGIVIVPDLLTSLVAIAGCSRTLRHSARYLESQEVTS